MAKSKPVGVMRAASCTRCGLRDKVDDDSTPHWCKECRAEYQRNYRSSSEIRAFAMGARAMRESLSGEFAKKGALLFAGAEIARIIRDVAPAPEYRTD
jgi:hypothetical protein